MPDPFEDVIGEEAATRLTSPTRPARGLPGQAYSSQALLELEYERLYAPSWIYVGNAHEVPEPGDARSERILGLPILLLRDSHGEVRVFHNACRHRGTRLLNKPCSGLRSIVCPYHGWAYHLDGRLKASPNFGGHRQATPEGFDPADFGLKSLRCDVWGDWIFINPDGTAPPLQDYLKPLLAEVTAFSFDSLTPFLSLDFGEVPANWKLILENSLENYHVPIVHAKTAAKQPLEDHFSIISGACIGSGIDIAGAGCNDASSADAGPESLDMSARYIVLLPNLFLVTYAPDIVMTRMMLPLAPDKTTFRVYGYTTTGGRPPENVVEDWRRLTVEVEEEDIQIHREQQAGQMSPAMNEGSVLSPAWEQSVHAFHEYLVGKLR